MEFIESAQELHVPAGRALIEEGEVGDDVYFIVEGVFEVSYRNEGAETAIGRREAGDLVGELAAPAAGARSATVRALTDGCVHRVSRSDFDRWLNANPDLAERVEAQTRHRLDETRMIQVLTGLVGPGHGDVVADIVSSVEWVHLTSGSQLFAQDDPSDAAYFIVSGRLRAFGVDHEENRRFDLELGRGDLVGEMGLIDNAPRSGTVVAVRDSTLARLSLETFQRLTVRHPAVMLRVFRHLLVRLTRPQHRSQRGRAIAVVVTAATDGRVLASQLVQEIERHGSVSQVRAASVDAELSRPGIAQSAPRSSGSSRVVNLLHEHELSNDYVLYETEPLDSSGRLTSWSERAIRQADRLLVVASAAPDEAERAALAVVLDASDQLEDLTVWAAIQHPAGTEQPATEGHPLDARVSEIHHLRHRRLQDLQRLARLASGNGVALVLSGGGARGYAHIGAIQALDELGVPIDRIGGASIGSVIAAGASLDLSHDDLLREVRTAMSDPVDYTIPVVSLAKGERVWNATTGFFGDRRIEDTWIPYFCVSTNLTHARVERHHHGPIAEAIRASVAIPGVFPPVVRDQDLLVDGGVLDNLPVDVVADDPSIRHVIAVEVSPPNGPRARGDFGLSVSGWSALRSKLSSGRSEYPALSTVLMASLLVGSSRDRRRFMDEDMVDLLIDLNLSGVGLLEFGTVEPVAERGYKLARPIIESWAADQAWLDSGNRK